MSAPMYANEKLALWRQRGFDDGLRGALSRFEKAAERAGRDELSIYHAGYRAGVRERLKGWE